VNDLLDRLYAAGFTVELTGTGPQLVPHARGLTVPADLLAEVKRNRGEIVAHLMAQTTPPLAEAEFCRVCARLVHPTDRERMSDPTFCSQGGAREVRDRSGNVIHKAEPKCPFKE
jgi:hypothetical protein